MSHEPRHPCSVEGCDRWDTGYMCATHAYRVRKYGEPGPAKIRRMIPAGTPAADKIDIIGWTVAENGCWEWNGRRGVREGPSVYGRVDDETQVARLAHRIAYMKWVGPLDDDLVLMHKCDNPICINPEHLLPGTQAENLEDMMRKGRGKWQKQTHCKHGHEFTPENTSYREGRDGKMTSRKCIQCSRDNAAAAYAARKSAA